MGNREKPKIDKCVLYAHILQLRASGTGNYHSLVNTYVFVHSIIIVIIGYLLNPHTNLIVRFMSIVGLFLSLQMYLAQGRLLADNIYWENWLKCLEQAIDFGPHKPFTDRANYICDFDKYFHLICRSRGYLKPAFTWGNQWPLSWLLSRMKIFPFVFAFIYIFLIGWTFDPF